MCFSGWSGLVDEDRLIVFGSLDMPDEGVAPRREDAFVTVLPPHAVVLVLGCSEDLEDLTAPAGLAEPMPVHDDEIADVCA
jgi:hypothetical protein